MNRYTSSIALLFVLGSTSQLFAQSKILTQSGIEFIAGPTQSRNIGNLTYKTMYGYAAGIGIYHDFSPRFEVILRGTFEQKGSESHYPYSLGLQNGDNFNINERTGIRFNYFTTTLLPTFRLGHKKNLQVGAGGYYSALRNTHSEQTLLNVDTQTNYAVYKDRLTYNHYYDAGLTFSVGHTATYAWQRPYSGIVYVWSGGYTLGLGCIAKKQNMDATAVL